MHSEALNTKDFNYNLFINISLSLPTFLRMLMRIKNVISWFIQGELDQMLNGKKLLAKPDKPNIKNIKINNSLGNPIALVFWLMYESYAE